MDIYKLIRTRMSSQLKQKAFKSPWVYKLLKQMTVSQKKNYAWETGHQIVLEIIDQAASAYLQKGPVVWHNIFFPTEILYGLGVIPFAPEAAAAVAVGMGVAEEAFRVCEKDWVSGECCSFHRLAYGCDRAGYFPTPQAIVCTSHLCDAAPQGLAATAANRGIPFYLLDVPHEQHDTTVDYVARQLEDITLSLAKSVGVAWEPERLRKALLASNAAREHLLAINRLRGRKPTSISGSEAHSFVYLALAGFGADFAESLYKQLEAEMAAKIQMQRLAVPEEKGRIVWLHLRPYYPNDIFDILEKEAGVVIIFEEMTHIYWEAHDPDRPWHSLARKVLSHHALGPMDRRIKAILDMVDDYQATGVVHFAHWGCRQSTAGLRLLQEALRERQIPFLNLEGDCVDASKYAPGATRTRLEGFLEMLG